MRPTVVLGVSGGIAAFRAIEVLRSLVKAGCRVFPILTRNAAHLISPRTFAVLSGEEVQVSLWKSSTSPGIDHIDLARRADLLLIAPATANVLAKVAAGIADDALTTYALAHRGPTIVAPAMNTFMLRHQATQAALDVLRQRGVRIVAAEVGELACGEVGEGKLATVDRIVAEALAALPLQGPLAGLSMLVTAGPTRESIDQVRVITNRSSGRMGIAIAAAAASLGARVVLLAGQAIEVPASITTHRFDSAADLEDLLVVHAPTVDCVWQVAAVADFRPKARASGKLDRRKGDMSLEIEPVPDLAAGILRPNGRPYVVIFAAQEAKTMEERARTKLADKNADAVVANPIDEVGVGMEVLSNRAVLLTRQGLRREFAIQSKENLARQLVLTLTGEILSRRS